MHDYWWYMYLLLIKVNRNRNVLNRYHFMIKITHFIFCPFKVMFNDVEHSQVCSCYHIKAAINSCFLTSLLFVIICLSCDMETGKHKVHCPDMFFVFWFFFSHVKNLLSVTMNWHLSSRIIFPKLNNSIHFYFT